MEPPTLAADFGEKFNAQEFKPGIDPYGYGVVNGARSLYRYQVHLASYVNWSSNPVRFVEGAAVSGGTEILKSFTMFDLVGGIGLLRIGKHGGLEIGGVMPYVLDNRGVKIDDRDAPPRDFGFGAIRNDVKLTLFDRDEDVLGLAFRGFVEYPTARRDELLSYNGRTAYAGTIIVEKRISQFRFGFEGGYEYINGTVTLGGTRVDDKLLLGAAVAFEPFRKEIPISLFGEIHHFTPLDRPYDHEVNAPIEIGGGLKYTGFVYMMLGGGLGLNFGVGAPDARVFGGIGITF